MGLLSKAIITASPNPPRGGRPGQSVAEGYPKRMSAKAKAKVVQDMLLNYWLQNSPFQGIVLGLPKYAGEAGVEQFLATVAVIVASFGGLIRLPSKNILILFSHTLDRELLVHRLTRTLRTQALVSFKAVSPGEALARIQSCL
jgi:hypothetical protein